MSTRRTLALAALVVGVPLAIVGAALHLGVAIVGAVLTAAGAVGLCLTGGSR